MSDARVHAGLEAERHRDALRRRRAAEGRSERTIRALEPLHAIDVAETGEERRGGPEAGLEPGGPGGEPGLERANGGLERVGELVRGDQLVVGDRVS
jgi:hypothetical protein